MKTISKAVLKTISEAVRTQAIRSLEARLCARPDDPLVQLIMEVTVRNLPAASVAHAIGVREETYRRWEDTMPVLSEKMAAKVRPFNTWLAGRVVVDFAAWYQSKLVINPKPVDNVPSPRGE